MPIEPPISRPKREQRVVSNLPSGVCLRRAIDSDAPAILGCVTDAYRLYIKRLGKPPGPMLDDYRIVIRDALVWVLESQDQIIGAVVLKPTDSGLLLDNVSILPSWQGKRLGRFLVDHAETYARDHAGGQKALELYTHELMTENIAMYKALGYYEIDRRMEHGYQRVYMRKNL